MNNTNTNTYKIYMWSMAYYADENCDELVNDCNDEFIGGTFKSIADAETWFQEYVKSLGDKVFNINETDLNMKRRNWIEYRNWYGFAPKKLPEKEWELELYHDESKEEVDTFVVEIFSADWD